MAIKPMAARPEISKVVDVYIQGADGVTRKAGDFKAIFEVPEQATLDAYSDVDNGYQTAEVMREVLKSVEGVTDAEGNALSGDDALSVILNEPLYVAAASNAFWATVVSQADARKNFKKQRRSGRSGS